MINGYEAVVEFDPVTGIYRGEFPGLNGRPDFYATDEAQVLVEGRRSLANYLERCTLCFTDLAGFRINDAQLVARVIDEQLLAGESTRKTRDSST